MTKSTKLPTNSLDYISKLVLPSLMKHKYSWPFLNAVDYVALNLPDYPKIIRHPMDFSKVRDKLRSKHYITTNDCVKDLKSIFSNCYLFNQPGEDVVYMALQLDRVLKEKLRCVSSESEKPFSNSRISTPLQVKGNVNGCDNISNLHGKRKLEDTEIKNSNKHQRLETSKSVNVKPILDQKEFDKCSFVIKEIMSSKYQQLNMIFLHPVDVKKLNLFDYYDIVKKPMDLSTIKSKLEANLYGTKEKFVEDVDLVFLNCIKYNGFDSELGTLAKRFQEIFRTIYSKAFRHTDEPIKSNPETQTITNKPVTTHEKIKKSKTTNEKIEPKESSDKQKIFELLNSIERRQDDVSYKFKKVQELVSVQNTEIKELYQKCFGNSQAAIDIENFAELGDAASLISESILSSSASTISNSRKSKRSGKPVIAQTNGIVDTPKSVKKMTPKSVKSNSKIKTESRKKPENPAKRSKSLIYQQNGDETKKKADDYHPMTYDEKKQLSVNINQLLGDQLIVVVRIIQTNEISLRDCDPEDLDIDFETLQTKTLRELEIFVNSVLSGSVSGNKNVIPNNPVNRNKSSAGELTVQRVPPPVVSGKQMRESNHSVSSSSSSSSSSSNSSSSSQSNQSIS